MIKHVVLCLAGGCIFAAALHAQQEAPRELPPPPPFPASPAPQTQLQSGQAGPIHFATRSPYDLQVLLQGKAAGAPTVGQGTLYLPAAQTRGKPAPAVVLLHGSGGIKPGREHKHAQFLTKNGIAAFVVDYYAPRGVTTKTPYLQKTFAATEWDVSADAFAALRLLSTHPDIHPQRIAVAGFSYGGMAARITMDSRIAEGHAPPAANFAAHIDFYGPCHFDLQTKRSTGAPLLTLRGARDASNHLPSCTHRENALREAGSAVDAIVFAGAGHSWDVHEARKHSYAPYIRGGCTVSYDAQGRASLNGKLLPHAAFGAARAARYRLRAASGEHYAACVKQGYVTGRDEKTRARADAVFLAWLKANL